MRTTNEDVKVSCQTMASLHAKSFGAVTRIHFQLTANHQIARHAQYCESLDYALCAVANPRCGPERKGRAVKWMPSFICSRPIACKAPADWIIPSARFEFCCDHAPSCCDRDCCIQCKHAGQPHFKGITQLILRIRHCISQRAPRGFVARSCAAIIKYFYRRL